MQQIIMFTFSFVLILLLSNPSFEFNASGFASGSKTVTPKMTSSTSGEDKSPTGATRSRQGPIGDNNRGLSSSPGGGWGYGSGSVCSGIGFVKRDGYEYGYTSPGSGSDSDSDSSGCGIVLVLVLALVLLV